MALRWTSIFRCIRPAVIGMIHVKALPGTPNSNIPIRDIIKHACMEAEIYKNAGVDAVLIENMHDIPYVSYPSIGSEIVASMTAVCCAVRKIIPHIPCGIQVLAAGNTESISIAHATGCQFIRAEGFVFGHMADEGFINACAGHLLRFRKAINANNVLIFTDVKKKHSSHAITNDVNVVDTARAAEFFLSDGIIVTGTSTGSAANRNDAMDTLDAVRIPVLVGSGVTKDNVHEYIKCHGLIVGSHFKKGNRWENDIVVDKVVNFMTRVRELKEQTTFS